MAALTLEQTRLYLHVDGTEEDSLIQTLMDSAKAFILQKIGKTKKVVVSGEITTETAIEETELFILAQKMLVAHWFYNRGVEDDTQKSKFSFCADEMIFQLTYGGDYV